MVKFKELPRPAGSGYLEPNAKPDKRGVWNLYENTSLRIGVFETSFWIELDDAVPSIEREPALDELATFIRDNVKANVVIVEHSHRIMMGGFGSGEAAGRDFLSPHPSSKKQRHRFMIIDGYEVRLMREDAVTFMSLWQGYEQGHKPRDT
jgi:hypothetical protein